MADVRRYDLTRDLLTVLFIGVLIATSFWILLPFLGATIWAVMIVVTSWSTMLSIQRSLGGRRWAAVTVMSLILLLLFVVPLSAAIATVVSNMDDMVRWVKQLRGFVLPPPPAWLADVPLIGARATELWQSAATDGFEAWQASVMPYARSAAGWLIGELGSVGALILQLLLTVVAAAVLYGYGEAAADWVLRFGERLGGAQGVAAVRLSGQAIRSVARGVIVTALVQSLVGGIGLWLASVPFAAVLTALMFLLAVAQIGAALVLVGPVIWLYWSGSPGTGTFLLIVTIVAATLDNVLRPILIKQGAADLPLLLIFVGVIGGLIGFGLIGIFIGPLVLAVAHTLMRAWLYGAPEAETRG